MIYYAYSSIPHINMWIRYFTHESLTHEHVQLTIRDIIFIKIR